MNYSLNEYSVASSISSVLERKFTMEVENEGKITDTVVSRNQDQTISTQWYSKPIASGRLLNFLSFHPTSMKMNVATNFIHRVVSLTTNLPAQQLKQVIYKHLRLNNYPASLINRLLNHNNLSRTPNQPNHPTIQATATTTDSNIPINCSSGNQLENTPPPIIYRSLPHIPILTSSLVSTFKKDFPNVKIAYKTISTNSHILQNIRDPIQHLQKSKIIYQIRCIDCEMSYIGMTKNKLQTRLYGHTYDQNKYQSLVDSGITNIDEQRDRLKDRTALIDHCIVHRHRFDLNNVKIIDNTFKASALPILEMCHIASSSHTVNHRTDVDGLSTTYSGIIHSVKTNLSRRSHTNTNNNPK